MAIRKKFINVKIPAIDSTLKVLGTPEELHKKTIKLDLSRKMRGKGLEIIFQIYNQEGKLVAFPKKVHLMKSYLQRMMRKRTSYVEDSFQTICKDSKAIIKPFLITRKKVSRAVRRNLRNTTKEFLIAYTADKNYLDICEDILHGELQRNLLPKLKKVYPLSLCDIRVFETNEMDKVDLTAGYKKVTAISEDNLEEDEEGVGNEEEVTEKPAEDSSEEIEEVEKEEVEIEKKTEKKETKKKVVKKATKKETKKKE